MHVCVFLCLDNEFFIFMLPYVSNLLISVLWYLLLAFQNFLQYYGLQHLLF